MRFRHLALIGVLLAAGCASERLPPPPMPPVQQGPIVLRTPFRASDFQWSTGTGANSLQGMAMLNGGQTCAGKTVALTPDAPYSRERIARVYGSADYASMPVAEVKRRRIANDAPELRQFVRATQCGPNGRFVFENLPDGGYFVVAQFDKGGEPWVVVQRVGVRGGGVKRVAIRG